MVVAHYNEELFDFAPIPDALPPREEQAEEAILGGVLLDPEAIFRVWHRLKPEHFQVNAHKELYQAFIKLAKNDRSTDFITVSSWLSDKGLLERIGGRSKLLSLLEGTVSAANIDNFADLVIGKAVRKDLIKFGSTAMKLGYDTSLDIEEALAIFKRKAEDLVELESVRTEEELIKSKHDRLIAKIRHIHTTVTEPSLKYMRLKYLADESGNSISFLEKLYFKSLASACSKLMTYEDLKEAAGSSIRRWLQQGLIPLGSTVLLTADGGVGKTKLVYSLAKNLIQGTRFGDFLPTGEKRRILFYQGDEQEADMLQSLQMLGYEEGDITKYIRTRFNWAFENMATLIEDINEFKPDFVVLDSLTFGNRFAIVKENDMEYARPILELNALATQHNFTPLLIHHTNRLGDARGSTAIRNAVSEAWKLHKDTKPEATKYDRILEIDKSRSRSSGTRYRLYFDPDTLGFTFLGQEVDPSDTSDKGMRGKLLEFFQKNPNEKYTSKELSTLLNIASGNCRRLLNEVTSEGLLSVERKPGKSYTYYLEFAGNSTMNEAKTTHITINQRFEPMHKGDQGDHPKNVDHLDDHLQDIGTASDIAKADHVIIDLDALKKGEEDFEQADRRSDDQLCPKTLPGIDPGGDHRGDRRGDHRGGEDDQQEGEGIDPSPSCSVQVADTLFPIAQTHSPGFSRVIKSLRHTVVGEVKTMGEQIGAKQWRFTLILSDGTEIEKIERIGNSKPENRLKDRLDIYLRTLVFSVFRTDGSNEWEENCKWTETTDSYNPMRSCHRFVTSDNKNITMVGIGDDRIRVKK